MEVDADIPKTPPPRILGSAFTLSPPLPSVAEPPHFHFLQGELDALNKSMNDDYAAAWSTRIQNDGHDPKKRAKVFADILITITDELPSKKYFIGSISRSDAKKLIENLDDNEFKELLHGVKAGIEEGDWARLALHCTFSVALYLEVWRDSSLHSDT